MSWEHDKSNSNKCPICKGMFEVNITLKGHISAEQEKNKSKNAQSVMWYLK